MVLSASTDDEGKWLMKIRTFADPSGCWSAVVPAVGSVESQRKRARRAIAAEVRMRQGDEHPVIRLGNTPPTIVRQRTAVRVWAEA